MYLSTEKTWCSICKSPVHNTGNCATHTKPNRAPSSSNNAAYVVNSVTEDAGGNKNLQSGVTSEFNSDSESQNDTISNPPSPKGSKRNLSINSSSEQQTTTAEQQWANVDPYPKLPVPKKTIIVNDSHSPPTLQNKSKTPNKTKTKVILQLQSLKFSLR